MLDGPVDTLVRQVKMTEPTFTAVSRAQGNNRAIKAGEVVPEGCRLDFEEVPVLVKAFRRMVREQAWDVCEMAFTTYLCARRYGVGITALPVFLVRDFHHGAIMVNRHAGINAAADLAGREVGVNRGYTVTTGVWARGVLADEAGLDLSTVTWRPSGDEHVAQFRAPDNVVPLTGDTPLAERVISGELPAAVGLTIDHPDVRPLIADPEQAGYAALRSRGHYPINHLVVVRSELADERPELAANLFDAFATSKRRYVDELLADRLAAPTPVDRMHREVHAITGADPLPYGIAPNRPVIEELLRHAVAQGVLAETPDVESLFAAATVDLQG
jgi:4,5-dihydroxyphthalate decarboxylase